MKFLSSLVLTAFVVTLFTSAASAAKKSSSSSTSEKQSSSANCSERLPMSALDCCNMPQFMSEVIITGCRAKVMQKLAGKPRNGRMEGPPEEFFDCLLETSNMGTQKKGKLVIDEKKSLEFLTAQLNETTKKDWTKAVTDANAACYKAYKKNNNNKEFYDCTVKELYVKCPKFSKTGECPKYQSHVKACKVLKLEYPRPQGVRGNGMRGNGTRGNGPRRNGTRPTGGKFFSTTTTGAK